MFVGVSSSEFEGHKLVPWDEQSLLQIQLISRTGSRTTHRLTPATVWTQLNEWQEPNPEVTAALKRELAESGTVPTAARIIVFIHQEKGGAIIKAISMVIYSDETMPAHIAAHIVAPYARGIGVGRNTLGVLEQLIARLGIKRILLIPTREARGFWNKRGYREVDMRTLDIFTLATMIIAQVPVVLAKELLE